MKIKPIYSSWQNYDVQFKSYVDIQFSPEMQDGHHDRRQNEAIGQYGILRWEHTNSLTGHPKNYKKAN